MRSLAIMRKLAPVVFDGTHSVQLPSAGGSENGRPQQSGGQPEFIGVLSRAAVAVGIDGVFLEVHDNPAQAKSDGANALPLSNLKGTLQQLLALHRIIA
jgi:2-dehydro-3-deoxyphosphooctonate aldolase (KDO 8-P synthase)